MMTTPRNSRLPLLCAALALAAVSHDAAALGDVGPTDVREQRKQEIAGKTEAERARLMRNFKAFRELDTAEQEKLRLLDAQLKEDARNQGNLRAIMNQYYDWLATLTPGQQDDL